MRSSIDTSVSSPRSSSLAAALAVRCRDVEKRFHFYEHRHRSLRGSFIRLLKMQRAPKRAPAFVLRRFNLDVLEGEAVALIGPNGSGKSTVLRLIAGIYQPFAGVVETRGTVAAVIELGAGFHPELTGTENVELYGAVMGLGRAQVRRHLAQIFEFAGVEEFADVPVKYYSSGMQARLAFAVTVCVEPDILLIDEVLAVGDQEFRERCLDRLRAFSANGGTLIVVSHDLETVSKLCSRGVWLEDGVVRQQGAIVDVCRAYREATGP